MGNQPHFRGVVRHTTRPGWWRVKIKHAGKFYSFGVYRDPERAAKMYDALAKQIFGDKAVFNFDGSSPPDVLLVDIWTMLRKKGLR
ncbi:MAG: hypothetical protein HQ567_27855 [Candidatus Nealsonbacteria bacterium]|nr:hypothetical protein [Candidatus Nealsonbacteria bacterium]